MRSIRISLTLLALVVLPLSAGSIIHPTSIVSNTAGEFAPGDANHMIDESGLSSTYVSGVTDFATYMATNPSHTFAYSGFEWFSPAGVHSGTIIYNLGASFTIL